MANRLEKESSPYLLQHADNPVDWYSWGEEAFQLAKDQDKPIFLSVGYAACHWCHVMAHESFEDEATAAVMNKDFINIKVDREERPDVDSIYMDAVVAMTGQGGWPMSVFLTPEAVPFYGGTYFPPQRRHNLPSFTELLTHISSQWKHNRQSLLETGTRLREHLSSSPSLIPGTEVLDATVLSRGAEVLFKTYDWTNGGWGGAPKFPQASAIVFLLQKYSRDGDKLALDMAVDTLRHMAQGGIYDQLAGGFHRYTVDEKWLVPHFEKMLYDNALLMQAYLYAWQITGEELFESVVKETLDFLIRDMRHPQGGFFSAIDADSEGQEGKFYAWSWEEFEEVIPSGEDFELATTAFGVSERGNFEGKNVLHRPIAESELADRFKLSEDQQHSRLDSIRSLLLIKREERIPPLTDDKVLTAWNGLLLISLAEAARAMDHEEYLAVAQSLTGFLLDHLIIDGSLKRSWREGRVGHLAFLEDHAALGLGLLALYQVDFNPRWYKAALDLAQKILTHFSDPQGGFFDTHDDQEELISRPKTLQDSPTPSGNSLAISLLLKLAALSGESRFSDPAESALRGMQYEALRYPTAFAGWLSNLDFALGPQLQLALIGEPQDARFKDLNQVLQDRYLPRMVIAGAEEGEENVPALLQSRDKINAAPTAYLCQGFSCKLPTNSAETLMQQIDEALDAERRTKD
jgi:uncharacterized protein YyaL (SSP411 family)